MTASIASLSGQIGILVVVTNVLLDQIGLPVPALPTLILAGAIAGRGNTFALELLAAAVLACLLPDSGWFLAGRVYGGRVMKLLCRISLNPDSCVSQTQLRFERWGAGALIAAKLVPGLAIIAPPLAGATGMSWPRFLLLNTAGAVLWVGLALGVGMLLAPQIDYLLPHLLRLGAIAAELVAVLLAIYIALKWHARRRFFAALRMARISVSELYQLIEAGAAPIIVDVRSATAQALEPRRLPGAITMTLQTVAQQLQQLPRDREIVLYCSCPNEASAAQVAKVLLRHGFRRVRPLQGGLDAWIAAGYAAELVVVSTAAP
jgi:membrane protein DedA with SNARE-associated domain/rhodanese-related sulfurtransferase